MPTFNLKKYAQAANVADNSKSVAKQLDDLREEYKQQPPEEGNTELQMMASQHKDQDATVPFNKQLEAARSGTMEGVTEKQLNKAPKLFNERRDDTAYGRGIPAVNLVAEGYDQKKTEAWNAAQEKQSRDTEFWDKMVGAQMIGEPTKIVSNDQSSQLVNHPDRFKGLKPDLSNEKEYNEFIEASLKHSDRMLFHIFANAASLGRKLTSSESQQVIDINSGKARLLASYEKKFADLLGADAPLGESNTQEPEQDNVSSLPPDTQPQQTTQQPDDSDGTYTIEPSQKGYALYKIPSQGGQKELVEDGFSSEQDAHGFAAHAPELDGYHFQVDRTGIQSTGNPQDFSPMQPNKPVTSPAGVPAQPQQPQGV